MQQASRKSDVAARTCNDRRDDGQEVIEDQKVPPRGGWYVVMKGG